MKAFMDTLEWVVFVAAILLWIAVCQGDPDVVDTWRCKALEIPMKECKSP